MQSNWQRYMVEHMKRVRVFASTWLGRRLEALSTLWFSHVMRSAASGDTQGVRDGIDILDLIDKHYGKIRYGTGLPLDTDIFD